MVAIENWYSNNPNVKIITNLDDIGQPHSCNAWGNQHVSVGQGMQIDDAIPLMTDDGNQDVLWGWFNTGSAFPSTVYLDHTMTVYFKANNPTFSIARSTIDAMLDECGDLCVLTPPIALFEYAVDGNTVSFIDLSELVNDGWNISEWSWNFGDGNTSNEQSPVHTYESDGVYSVSLTITTDTGFESDAYIDNIQIGALYADDSLLPNKIEIYQNYPNPFNPSTSIDYFVPNSGVVDIKVYDIYGNMVDKVLSDYKSFGHHSVSWDPNNLSSGVYFINIYQNNLSEKIKVMYTK
tara:strand:+ start:313 stop:1191 length:879 start_codon:yes stop_codon:yes gene_type:complete